MNEMQASRLFTLAHFLNSLPVKVFNLGNWMTLPQERKVMTSHLAHLQHVTQWGNPDMEDSRELADMSAQTMHECGTVACAVGWAGMLSVFHEEGFYLDKSSAPVFYQGSHLTTFYGWEAVRAFFGLSTEEANLLFSPQGYGVEGYFLETRRFFAGKPPAIGPKKVAAQIKQFVTDKGFKVVA